MKEKGDEKIFTNLEIYGNIKPEIKLQFLISKNLSSIIKKGRWIAWMSNYSKRKGIFVSIIISLVIWISLNFILIQFNENQKKE